MSTKSAEESPDTTRRDRAAIAAQACQTCRSRKSKCDEQRPKCGLCTRLGVECVYREPQPTKKDKTLVHILNVLERVESKVDRIGIPVQADSRMPRTRALDSAFGPSPRRAPGPFDDPESTQQPRRLSQTFPPADTVAADAHLTAAHSVLLWPSIYLFLTNARVPATQDLHYIAVEGTVWFTKRELHKHSKPLPNHATVRISNNPAHPPHSFSLGFAGLTAESITQLVDAYFGTFNVIHPILDRQTFFNDYINPVLRGGYEDRNSPTCLVMGVLALGCMAYDGTHGPPTSSASSPRSGFRGGTETEPPGLEFLNELRRRIGFTLNDCSLENVQVYILQAAYYEACARHMEYWRCCASASMAFQVFILCERSPWDSPRADLIKRVYWTCILHEDLYHLELDLPRTGIYTLEDKIPLPAFEDTRSLVSNPNDSSQYHYHFLAMIALRRLIARIHDNLHLGHESKAENSENYNGPPIHLIKELARQLESWRSYLPQILQWSDADAHSFPSVNPLSRSPPGPLFTPESLSPPPTDNSTPAGVDPMMRFNLDIVTGHLRTRFYYARYMIYRPFVFKALHFPEAMTPEDDAYAALCMQSACMWPLAMSPCRDKKRLIPHLFTWTQNFLGILLLLRVADENAYLRRICEERVSKRDMTVTAGLLLDWIADMRAVDSLAEWAYGVSESLFAGYR